jgi:adenylyl-sulfate kinase
MNKNKATVIWFTGLSGSGKTTISKALNKKLLSLGKSVICFDGDIVRNTINKNLGFSRNDIRENNKLIAESINKEVYKYNFILVPIISPFRKDRMMAKKIILGNFMELYIKTPLETCILRDTKGLYEKALNHELDNLIGFSNYSPYEPPQSADLEIDTTNSTIKKDVNRIINFLKKHEYLESQTLKEIL